MNDTEYDGRVAKVVDGHWRSFIAVMAVAGVLFLLVCAMAQVAR